MILAETAAWPITNAPTMLNDWPMLEGILVPASLKISKIKSIIRVSNKVGKGTPICDLAILSANGVGIISLWNIIRDK